MAGVATDLNAHQFLELAYLKWRTPAKNLSKVVMVGATPDDRRPVLRGHRPGLGALVTCSRFLEALGPRSSTATSARPRAGAVWPILRRSPLASAAAKSSSRQATLGHVDHRADGDAHHVVQEAAGA